MHLKHVYGQTHTTLAYAVALLVPGVVYIQCWAHYGQFRRRLKSIGAFPLENLLGVHNRLHLLLVVLYVHLHLDLHHACLQLVELLLILKPNKLLRHEFNIKRLLLGVFFILIAALLPLPMRVCDFKIKHVSFRIRLSIRAD